MFLPSEFHNKCQRNVQQIFFLFNIPSDFSKNIIQNKDFIILCNWQITFTSQWCSFSKDAFSKPTFHDCQVWYITNFSVILKLWILSIWIHNKIKINSVKKNPGFSMPHHYIATIYSSTTKLDDVFINGKLQVSNRLSKLGERYMANVDALAWIS